MKGLTIKNKERKYFLTKDQIEAEAIKANQLYKEGKIVEKEIPEVWCSGVSVFSKKINLLLAIFLGIFAVDRFYLKKYLSAVIKLIFIVIITPVFLYLTFGTNLKDTALDVVIVFSFLFYATAIGFYLTDIIIGIIKPRDYQFKEVR